MFKAALFVIVKTGNHSNILWWTNIVYLYNDIGPRKWVNYHYIQCHEKKSQKRYDKLKKLDTGILFTQQYYL